jgi:hypothetical protein
MFSRYSIVSFLVLFLLGIASCKKEQSAPQFHYEYFDLTHGRYIDYDVMEIAHDVTLAVKHDTTRYQLRTLIGDTIIDNEGRIARKFIRFKRDNSSLPWVQTDIWTAIIDQNRAELVEENQRIIKLVFAPTLTKEWNPNAFNMFDEMEAYYKDIHDEKTVGGIYFDSTLTVELDSFISLIDYRRKYEVYSKGVGLVRKYWKDLTISNFDTLNVQFGTESFYTVIGYGIQ